jgi:AcrR family transcriptional regulator
MPNKSLSFQRRSPKQARSRATVEAILEAAAQILERRGADALTTNDVAERAGVSIGTLYQYFPDKAAILVAAARRELGEAPTRRRAVVEALIDLIERFGATPAQVGVAKTAKPIARRRPSVGAQAADLLEQLIDALLPTPPLRPIPIRVRTRR